MLKIRFARFGKKKKPFYQIVLTEHTRPVKSGFIKKIGFYNPLTKELSIDEAEMKKYIGTGAQLSDSLKKVLLRNKVSV